MVFAADVLWGSRPVVRAKSYQQLLSEHLTSGRLEFKRPYGLLVMLTYADIVQMAERFLGKEEAPEFKSRCQLHLCKCTSVG